MATHDQSMTCVADAHIEQYAIVKIVPNIHTNGLPHVEMCDASEDTIFGVCMTGGEVGEWVTVRFPFSGLLPAYCYTNPRSGNGLTIGVSEPGSLSNNTDSAYARKVAYVVQTGAPTATGGDLVWCMIAFVRANFI